MDKHHDLIHEFPELRDKIHELKLNNHHFRNLFDEYHKLDHLIHSAETNTEPTNDEHLNEMRLKRVHLKDELYKILTEN